MSLRSTTYVAVGFKGKYKVYMEDQLQGLIESVAGQLRRVGRLQEMSYRRIGRSPINLSRHKIRVAAMGQSRSSSRLRGCRTNLPGSDYSD